MKKRYWLSAIATVVLAVSLTLAVWAQNEKDVIEISSAEDFLKISQDLDGKYVLTNDIDLSSADFEIIGSSAKPFSGVLDGAGHTVTVDLSASKTENELAIFHTLTGTVKNLNMDGKAAANVQGADVAILAANAADGATVQFCENRAELSAIYAGEQTCVAPFVARVTGGQINIERCMNFGEISVKNTQGKDAAIGGIAGFVNDDATINVDKCANRAHITVDGGRSNIGGIVGQTSVGSTGTIANINLCCNTGDIDYYNEAGERAAGIIGYIKGGEINYCYNIGNIKAYSDSGDTPARREYGKNFGIFGYANLTTGSSVNVVGCFNATADPLEAEICVVRNAKFGFFDNFVMEGRSEYELELNADNVSAGEKGTEFTDADHLLTLLNKKCSHFVKNENGGYPVFMWEQGGVLSANNGDLGLAISFRQNPDNKDAHDIRFLVVAKNALFDRKAKTKFKIEFYKDGKLLTEHTPILSRNGSEFTLYNSIYADKVEYKAEKGSSLYVSTIAKIPYEAWDSIEVFAEQAGEYVSLGRVKYETVYNHSGIVTFDGLPEYRTEKAMVSKPYNCGTMLGDDSGRLVGDETYMYVISATNREEFDAYVDRLANEGCVIKQDVTIDSNRTCTFAKNGEDKYYVAYYLASKKQTRIVEENASNVLPTELSYDAPASGAQTPVLYQYSLNYTGASVSYQDSRAINCGMLYMIKLPDNTLFVVDGGHGNQVSDYSLRGIYDFMKQITGTADNEKIPITGWFFTHAHGDHNGLTAAFLGYRYENHSTVSFADKVDVKSVIFNYPSYQTMSSGYALTEVKVMKQAMRELYPNIKTLKVHTGQRFTLAGVQFDVLFTHEDLVNSGGKTSVSNFNDTSTVLKVTFPNGQTYMQLGDMDKSAMNSMNAMYSDATMRSDIVQISHHAFNNLRELYSRINAPIALVPNSEANAKNSQWGSFAPYSSSIYCADAYTFAFEMKDGKVIGTRRYNHVG